MFQGWWPWYSRDCEAVLGSSLHMSIIYFLWWTNWALISPHDYYVFSLVDKPGIHESWNSDFKVKFDCENEHQSIPQTIRFLTNVFCIFCSNLVILAWMGHKLSHRQALGWHTHRHTCRHTHTDAGNDNNRRPKLASGKNYIKNTRSTVHHAFTYMTNFSLAPSDAICHH